MKILVAEDNYSSRKLMNACLESLGECDVVVNGVEAVSAFERELAAGKPYKVICLDIMMPEMDGQEALIKIRQIEEAHGIARRDRVKILMVTALEDIKTIMTSYHSLCDGYLMKPVYRDSLLEQILAVYSQK